MNQFFRKDISNLEPYNPVKAQCSIKLDANESPYDIPVKVKEGIWEKIKEVGFNYYADPSCDELREGLSRYTGVKPEEIFVGSGADEVISNLIFAFGGHGRDIIIPIPTFSSYEIFGAVAGSNVIKVPLLITQKNNLWTWELDVAQIKKHFKKDKPQMMFLCYPNNPTGNYFDEEKVIELIKDFNGIVVIDEAYFEFGGKTLLSYLSDYPHMVIIRTFSKLFSIAGLRVGYGIGHKDLIYELNKVKLPYNVSLFSQVTATEILKETKWLNTLKQEIIKSRKLLKESLEKIPGIRVYPSSTNFLLCELEKSRDIVYRELLKRGILVRRLRDKGLENTLRFGIGTPEQNAILLTALGQIMR